MKAARLYGVRDLRVEEVYDPTPGADEALIQIHACGVCPSDLRAAGDRSWAAGGSRLAACVWHVLSVSPWGVQLLRKPPAGRTWRLRGLRQRAARAAD